MSARRILVPLLVLAAAGAIWLWPVRGAEPIADVSDDVLRCSENLRRIYTALVARAARDGSPPRESGVALLGALVASGTLPDDAATRALLTCPGPNAAPVPPGTDYRDLAALTGASSAYACRDGASHPLAKFPSGGAELEPLVACDDARGMNHDGALNVLYSDGSVRTLILADEIARGRLPPGATTIPVGPSSPLPELRVLVRD